MTRKEINEIFCTELGQQLNEVYTTSDDRVFIRMKEATLHIEGKLDDNTLPLPDTTIKMWYALDEGYYIYKDGTWKGYENKKD